MMAFLGVTVMMEMTAMLAPLHRHRRHAVGSAPGVVHFHAASPLHVMAAFLRTAHHREAASMRSVPGVETFVLASHTMMEAHEEAAALVFALGKTPMLHAPLAHRAMLHVMVLAHHFVTVVMARCLRAAAVALAR